jgi:hypothetical protein
MDSTNTCPSYFTLESYQDTYNTKDPDDIYVNESLVNLLDSKCTHFEKQSTHLEENEPVYRHQQQQQRRQRYLKWIDVEAATAKKYRDNGEGITYQDILNCFPALVRTNGQAQDILRNNKNKGKLYTGHRTKPQQYFLSNEQAQLATLNYKKCTRSDPIEDTTFSTRQKPHLYLYSDKYPSYQKKNDLVVGIPKEEQELIAQNTIQAIQLASSGRIPTGMHNILIHLTLFPGTEQEAYHTSLADVPPSQKYNKVKFLETKIDGHLIQYQVYPKGKVIIHIPSTRRPFVILDDYASSQLTSSAYTFLPDYFLPFVAQIRDFLQRRLSDNIQCKIVPPLQGLTSTWVLKHADLNWDVPTTPLNYKVFSSPVQIPHLNGIFLRVYRKMSLQHRTQLRVEEGVHKFNSSFTDATSSLGPTIISAAKDAMQKLSLISKEGGVVA